MTPAGALHRFGHLALGACQRLANLALGGHLPPFAAAIVVVEQDDRVLLLRRVDGQGLCLPGGFAGLTETVEQAARREVTEETGLVLGELTLWGTLSGERPDCVVKAVDFVFGATPVGGELRESREGAPVWLRRDAIGRLAFGHQDALALRPRGGNGERRS